MSQEINTDLNKVNSTSEGNRIETYNKGENKLMSRVFNRKDRMTSEEVQDMLKMGLGNRFRGEGKRPVLLEPR